MNWKGVVFIFGGKIQTAERRRKKCENVHADFSKSFSSLKIVI